jgi:uncharacterized protein (UPF0332 family)
MAYHDDLLSQALELVHTSPPTQANLRRAVSAAYYAVFHFLITEATSNWNNVELRAALGRASDHGLMRAASNRILNTADFPFTGEDSNVVNNLRFVARTFTQLQENRHFADYNLTKELEPTDALNKVRLGERIFKIWPSIRTQQIAQEYLVSLLVKHRS